MNYLVYEEISVGSINHAIVGSISFVFFSVFGRH